MSVFLTSIQSIIPIIVIIVLGYILQTRGWFADSFGGSDTRLPSMQRTLEPPARTIRKWYLPMRSEARP